MSAAIADALCEVLEEAEPRARASAVLPLLRESFTATWQALTTNRPELVAEFVSVDMRVHGDSRSVDQEVDRVFATLTALSENGPDLTSSSFLDDLLAFTNSVTEDEYGDEAAQIPEREPVLAVWHAAGALHDLLEDLRGGDDFVTEPFPYPMAELITAWPAPDPRRTALIEAAIRTLRSQVRP